jgi:small subunit ribosomal protein S3
MINVFISCGQPGAVLGKEGANIPIVTLAINKIVGRKIKVNVNVLTYENAC